MSRTVRCTRSPVKGHRRGRKNPTIRQPSPIIRCDAGHMHTSAADGYEGGGLRYVASPSSPRRAANPPCTSGPMARTARSAPRAHVVGPGALAVPRKGTGDASSSRLESPLPGSCEPPLGGDVSRGRRGDLSPAPQSPCGETVYAPALDADSGQDCGFDSRQGHRTSLTTRGSIIAIFGFKRQFKSLSRLAVRQWPVGEACRPCGP